MTSEDKREPSRILFQWKFGSIISLFCAVVSAISAFQANMIQQNLLQLQRSQENERLKYERSPKLFFALEHELLFIDASTLERPSVSLNVSESSRDWFIQNTGPCTACNIRLRWRIYDSSSLFDLAKNAESQLSKQVVMEKESISVESIPRELVQNERTSGELAIVFCNDADEEFSTVYRFDCYSGDLQNGGPVHMRLWRPVRAEFSDPRFGRFG